MNGVPQIAAVSDVYHKQEEVFDMMVDGPIILAQHYQPRAVLVSIDHWNTLIEKLYHAQLFREAQEIYDRNEENDSWIEFNDLLAELEQKHDPALIQQIREGIFENVAR